VIKAKKFYENSFFNKAVFVNFVACLTVEKLKKVKQQSFRKEPLIKNSNLREIFAIL
jgi:hypothetical protein